MRGNNRFKRFVYNYGLELLKASWDFEDIKILIARIIGLKVRSCKAADASRYLSSLTVELLHTKTFPQVSDHP